LLPPSLPSRSDLLLQHLLCSDLLRSEVLPARLLRS
jgi:hypothetical protein